MQPSALTPRSVSRIERKRAHNRQALVSAARHLFARDGFEATTISAVAEEADLGFGTFYRYFPDKEAVLRAVLDEGRAEIDAVLLAPDTDSRTAADALRRLSERVIDALERNRDLLQLMWETAIRDAQHSGRRTPGDDEQSLPALLGGAIARLIARGVEAGEFATGEMDLRARFLTGAYLSLLVPLPSGVTPRTAIGAMDDFALRALGARLQPLEGK
jgi:AcrR family transcriptional regulator